MLVQYSFYRKEVYQIMPGALFWNHSAAGTTISFDNTPFQIGYKRDLECQYGNHYYKNKRKDPDVKTAEKIPE